MNVGRDWGEVSSSQGTLKVSLKPLKPKGEERKSFSLRGTLDLILDLILLSRTVR